MCENNRNEFDYDTDKQFIYFFKITEGFADEVHAQLVLSSNIEYVSKERQLVLKEKLKKLSSQIAGSIKYLESQNSK
ncbi:MAG: four helix bundle protein [Opitutales bacterium]